MLKFIKDLPVATRGQWIIRALVLLVAVGGMVWLLRDVPAIFRNADRTVNDNGFGTVTEIGAGIPKVHIPAGTFMMGSPESEPGRYDDKTPHRVTLSKGFHMSRYEITNAQYAVFLNAGGVGADGKADVAGYGNRTLVYPYSRGVTYAGGAWKAQAGYENHPVVNVTWFGAKAYADRTGGALPTEAQWEYACRAGSTTAYSYGAAVGGDYMWYWGNSGDTTHEVGQKQPNAYGLYDMHGNVFEWCTDWFGAYPADTVTDPAGPVSGSDRVLRGGSWSDVAGYSRSAFRYDVNPDYDNGDVGFRVVFLLP